MSTNNNSKESINLITVLEHENAAQHCDFEKFIVDNIDISDKLNKSKGYINFRAIYKYVIKDIGQIYMSKYNNNEECLEKLKKIISKSDDKITHKIDSNDKYDPKFDFSSGSKDLGEKLKCIIKDFEELKESEEPLNLITPEKYKCVYIRNQATLSNKKNKEVLESNKKNEELLQIKLKNLIANHTKQIIITGPPGTGKTRMAKEIANELGQIIFTDSNSGDIKYEFVQFHPSYDYTDFVEGLRPFEVGKGNETKMVFRKVDGIFKAFCRKVVKLNECENKEEQDERIKNNKYFFIIDEINRADLSKVLGELMFSLEGDKRGAKNRVQTQYNNIGNCYDRDGNLITKEHDDKSIEITREEDCFKKGFYIPENVIIIGTMNDIDRSVESMDFALRRRFTWVNAKVDTSMLLDAFNAKVKKNNSEEYELDEDGSPKYVFFNHIKDDRKIIEEKNEEGKETIGYKYKNTEINKIINTINELNYFIKLKGNDYSLNENYFISQGYFKDVPQDKTSASDILNYVWKYRLESLLYEYVRGEKENNIKTFISTCEDIFTKNKTVKTDSNSKNITEEDSTPKDDKASNTSKSGA